MDSLSQAVLGASVAAVAAPRGHRRKALLLGAALGTLPDLDVFIDYGDAVRNFTQHRGFSHSLFVLIPVSVLLWLGLKRWWSPAREAPNRWLAAILLALVTHPLLDAHTAYGTQLLWPLDVAPAMWATLFIIDPLYTLPLTIGVIAAALWPQGPRAGTTLHIGLAASTAYIAWSWIAHAIVMNHARSSLAAQGIAYEAIFITPTPLNTLLWRVVPRTEDGYLEGVDSLLLDEGQIVFEKHAAGRSLLSAASDIWSVTRLRWFAQEFVKAELVDGRLIVSDLRMGNTPNFVFSHAVAEYRNGEWQEVPTELQPFSFGDRQLAEVWQRIWNESVAAEVRDDAEQ